MVDRFLRPASAGEALRLQKETGGLFLAGGTELGYRGFPEMDTLISLAQLGLDFIRPEAEAVVIGPMVTLQRLADSTELASAGLAVLQRAALGVGSRPIRSLATVGGNVAQNRPCSDLIPTLWALDASLTLATAQGERTIGIGEHAAGPDGRVLILSVRVPIPTAQHRVAIERHSRTAVDLAVVNAALSLEVVAGAVRAPRLLLGGVAPTVARITDAEAAIDGAPVDGDLDDLVARCTAAVRAAIDPIDDLRGSAAYRTDVAVELTRRVLTTCLAEERS